VGLNKKENNQLKELVPQTKLKVKQLKFRNFYSKFEYQEIQKI
jgi:hypothetical protein